MADVSITLTESGGKGRYAARVAGVAGEAELTFVRINPKLMSADHTFAPDSMRGMGVARALVERMVADARAKGCKIIPVCPYVKAQRAKTPAWADVMDEG